MSTAIAEPEAGASPPENMPEPINCPYCGSEPGKKHDAKCCVVTGRYSPPETTRQLQWRSCDNDTCFYADSAVKPTDPSAEPLNWHLDFQRETTDAEKPVWVVHETSSLLTGLTDVLAGRMSWTDLDSAKAWCEEREDELLAGGGKPQSVRFVWEEHPEEFKLIAPSGKVAATVFKHRDAGIHHNWFVWDEEGTGVVNYANDGRCRTEYVTNSETNRWKTFGRGKKSALLNAIDVLHDPARFGVEVKNAEERP